MDFFGLKYDCTFLFMSNQIIYKIIILFMMAHTHFLGMERKKKMAQNFWKNLSRQMALRPRTK